MPAPDNRLAMTFGGGLNSRQRVADVQLDECVRGSENFALDANNRALMRRKPFDLITTVPNGEEIRGFAQLIKANGSVSTLVQAGGNVYSWDGDTSFTLVGSVNPAAKLRGPRQHNFTLDDIVLVTDLSKVEVVHRWDGTAFDEQPHDLGGDFIAKYCRVEDERAWFANVTTGGTSTPHVILASKIGDSTVLSNANRPSNSLGFDAAFFLISLDLKPINGIEEAFGNIIFSTERGRLYNLSGSDATDFQLNRFYYGSAVVGDEAIKNIGNDVVLGLAGRIESLSGTDQFGDVETDDLSQWIKPQIDGVTQWTIEYDLKNQQVLCFPASQEAVYVMEKGILGSGLSPWSKWTTTHSLAFQPSTVMAMIDPISLEDQVFMGDADGNIYRLNGGGAQDGGTEDIVTKRISGLFVTPPGNAWDVRGWVEYRRLFPTTVNLTVLGGGTSVHTQEVSRTLPQATGIAVYGGDDYYNDGTSFYGFQFSSRLYRQKWQAAGNSSHFQLQVEITSDEEFDIEEIGVEWDESED